MPEYLFQKEGESSIHSVWLGMKDKKEFRGPDGKDSPKLWKRIWTKPLMAVDSKPVDPYSANDFARVTNKKGTIGDLHDRAAELSQKRADKDGLDPIQEKFFDDYAAKRKGKEHPIRKRRKSKAALDKVGISITGLED